MLHSIVKGLKRWLEEVELGGFARRVRHSFRLFVRKAVRCDHRLYTTYCRSVKIRKLQIGSGDNRYPGWLNCDFDPRPRDIFYLDATKPFPFAEETFDIVFSQHMIEHIGFRDGLSMLRECYRVLRPGGRIRIATPDLRFLTGLYVETQTSVQNEYVDWSLATFSPDACARFRAFVVNNYVRAWGHQFIYDEETLHAALRLAGFVDIVTCQFGESSHPSLQGIEGRPEYPSRFFALETIVCEASKAQPNN